MDFTLICKIKEADLNTVWYQERWNFCLAKKESCHARGWELTFERYCIFILLLIDKNIYLRSNNISTFLIARCLNLTHFWSSTELAA